MGTETALVITCITQRTGGGAGRVQSIVTIKGDKWDYPELLVTPVGTLFVRVVSAKLVRDEGISLFETVDPYVVLGVQGETEQRTPTLISTLTPTWDDQVSSRSGGGSTAGGAAGRVATVEGRRADWAVRRASDVDGSTQCRWYSGSATYPRGRG